MFFEHFDFKRSAWDPEILSAILTRLQESGYQGFTFDANQVLGRYTQPHADSALGAVLAHADSFTDVLIPPAQPRARVILHRAAPEVLRIVVIGRSQHEVRMAVTALKMHLEAVLGSRIRDMTDEAGRASLTRFRRDVLPGLRLTGDGGPPVELRNAETAQLLTALRHQPAFRGKPTVLGSHVAVLAPERPAAQVRETLEHLVGAGVVERWHVVVCREGGQWLAVSPRLEEIKSFISLNVDCPHCGKRVSEEQPDVAYRAGDAAQAYLSKNRWVCDLVETALRRLGVEAVAVQPGAGPVDGAACYYDTVLLFRAKEAAPAMADVAALREESRRLESDGWRVFPVLIADQATPAEIKDAGMAVIDSLASVESVLEDVLKEARVRTLSTLLPPVLRPVNVPLADLLPAD